MGVAFSLSPGYPSTANCQIETIEGILASLTAQEVAGELAQTSDVPDEIRLEYAEAALDGWTVHSVPDPDVKDSIYRLVAGGGTPREYIEHAIRAVIRCVLDAAHVAGMNVDVRTG